jgi:acyl-CoA thioesterase FadM
VIVGLADHQSLAASVMAGLTTRFAPTINMGLDFIFPAKLGDWLELETDLRKATRQFLFTQAVVRDGEGALVAQEHHLQVRPTDVSHQFRSKPATYSD